MNRRNPDFCSVFRSELIAIYEALKSIRNTNYQDIWILTDSRSAIQHLSHTGDLRDKKGGQARKLEKTRIKDTHPHRRFTLISEINDNIKDGSSNGLGYVAQMKEPSVFSRNYYLVVQNYLRILEFWAQNIELEVDEDHSMLPCTHSIYCCAPSHTEEFEERQVSPMARMKVTPTRYHAPETPPPIFSPKKEEEVVAATASTHNPHRCRFCDYSSRWKQNVINHQYTHTGEKPYQCQHCNYKTTQQSRLKQHTYVHTKEKPYRCQHCSFTTAYGSYLKIHIQKNHSPSEQSPTALYHPFDITSLLSRV
ncbi:hypothetical protein LAZ67_9002427 [Cordylochernes scorpioides]|uniref:C2H2-type domain-containing protein n=1 Tax=Cordylochernes scorpioides TaxID=51811 RepID=A0ABY6KUB1_9ARAC|nr:hypothetical protein LAZ67_9002427 [Cordylochernes scorpioides]